MARLEHVDHTGRLREYELTRDAVYVGRSGEADICVPFPFIGRWAFRLVRASGRYLIEELLPSRGSHVVLNGRPMQPGAGIESGDGDEIRVGDALFVYRDG